MRNCKPLSVNNEASCLYSSAGPGVKLSHEKLILKAKEKLSLEAMIDGLPKPKVEWKFNGVDVSGNKNVICENKKDKYLLRVNKVDETYTGLFTIIAINEAGQSEASCNVVVEYPPRFTKELENNKCLLESSYNAEIEVEGMPEPKVTWFKDDKPLIHSECVQSDGSFKLHFEKFQISDSGVYRVVAANSSGTAKTEAHLEVLGKTYSFYP